MDMKHYVVILEGASKTDSITNDNYDPHLEYHNAKKIRADIQHVTSSLGMADQLNEIQIIPGAPVMYIECTEDAIEKIKNVHGVKDATPNMSFEPKQKPAPRAVQQPPKRKGPFGIFKR